MVENILYVFTALAICLTYFEIKTRNMPLGAVASGIWQEYNKKVATHKI